MYNRFNKDHFLDIYLANVNWPFDVKDRPALVMKRAGDKVKVLRITTKFPQQKSKWIGKKYLPIIYWRSCGLMRPSCVDINRWYAIPLNVIIKNKLIGKLDSTDSNRLFKFIIENLNEI